MVVDGGGGLDDEVDEGAAASRDGFEVIAVRVERDGAGEGDGGRAASSAGSAGQAGGSRTVRHLAVATDPIIGPGPTPAEELEVALPRLARHELTLEDGHTVGVAVCGHGVPLVVVHGFTAEGILYAQTLSRLVDLGFKVIAVDTAGHGGTLGLPTGAGSMRSYSELLGRVLDHLGVGPAVFAGHSMGGRLITELAAREPQRAIAVVLLDAIVGDTWDRMVYAFRLFPPLMLGVGGGLVVDTVTTMPLFRDPVQAAKLVRLVTPTLLGHVRRPWRLLAPAVSIIRSRGSRWMLDKLGDERIPVFAIHGDRDMVVPLSTGRAAARRGRGELVVVRGASHSWLLKDPETLPAILHQLMGGRLGTAVLKAQLDRGVDPVDATAEEVEAVLYEPDALVLELTPRHQRTDGPDLHRPPRYRWYVEQRTE
jgi:pimeloyl-ACP methyl ester carboxylesterase